MIEGFDCEDFDLRAKVNSLEVRLNELLSRLLELIDIWSETCNSQNRSEARYAEECRQVQEYRAWQKAFAEGNTMTLRDWFAMAALTGLSSTEVDEDAAHKAYRYADAMLKERGV
jgi:hypothetical protein